MELTRISHSCEFFKVDHPAVPTVISMVGRLLFSMDAVGRRYMDVATMSSTPQSLLLFYIFCGGGSLIFIQVAVV